MMKLVMVVGLGLDLTVLDGDPPPKRGANFRPMSLVAKRLEG